MKILFITQYYPPEIGAASNRIGYFAQFMAKAGHDVSVLTSSPNYPEGKIYPGYKNRYTKQIENGVTVHRTRILLTSKSTTISRLAHYLSFIASSLIAKFKIAKPDVIIATSPPLFVGLIGVIFKKLWHTKLITDIRDIWPESVESVGAVKNSRLLKQAKKLVQWIYKNSNHITVTSPGIQKQIHPPPPTLHPITIIPNGAELDLFKPETNGSQIRKKWNVEGKFVVLYTGNLGLAQAPEIFIKTAELLKGDHLDTTFLIVGSGVYLEKLQAEAQKKGLTNLIFTGVQPRMRMPEFVAAADVCIIPYKATDTFRNTFPSKMFDYMAGGKPILINLEGEASELIKKAKCGLLVKEENAQDMANMILKLKSDRNLTKSLGKAGREFVEQHYQRKKIATLLQEVVAQVANR
ncbi:glycosyltransferase family 4 protein [Candidatus Peregrinibacteria bacterium]|nr:glycosyltransferase family 4 protein [Candidatus Peregrinibacteria bacterium]